MSAADSECYKMNHKKRGTAVIFNNKQFDRSTGREERTGSEVDVENLYTMFSEMGFETIVMHDSSASAMEDTLTKIALENHRDADCFACVVLSHGMKGSVYGTDRLIEIDKLVAPFKGHRCETLAGKPKLFFIQACRGDQMDAGVDVVDASGVEPEEMDEDVNIRRIPTEADFLMAYSVVEGHVAWRHETRGSWFVQALVAVLRDNWKRMDLLTMMTRVSRKVAYDFESRNPNDEAKNRMKQIPCVATMLTRDVFFSPKKPSA